MPGIPEALVVLVIGALLFSNKLPQFGRKLGETFLSLKKSVKETQEELNALEKKEEKSKQLDHKEDS